MNVLEIYKKVIQLGISSHDELYNQRVQLINYLSFWLGVILLLMSILGLIEGQITSALINLSAVPFIILPTIYLNYRKKASVARWFSYLVGMAYVVYSSYVDNDTPYFLDTPLWVATLLVIGLFVFPRNELWIAFLLALLSYFSIAFIRADSLEMYLKVPIVQFTGHLVGFMVIFIVFKFYKRVRNQYEIKILYQKQDLETANEELKAQSEEIFMINETLSEQKKQLEDAHAVKDRLFSIIAHDLKVPFRTLKNMFDLMDISTFDDKDKEFFIAKIKQYNLDAIHLLDNLLLWARNQMTSESVKPQTIVLSEQAANCLALFKEVADEKNIVLDVHLESPFDIWADLDMILFVLRNLISNAIKFSHFDTTITIKAYKSAPWGVFEIQDNGVGMSEEKISRLFELSHERSLGTNKETGTGLGLPLCKIYVEKNYGKLEVESQEGKGSRFIVKLPLISHIV